MNLKKACTACLAVPAFALMLTACSSPREAPLDHTAEQVAIMAAYQKGCAGFSAGDIDGAMSPYARDLHVFDISPPHRTDYAHLRKAVTALREVMATNPSCTYEDMVIEVITPDFAYARYILPFSATLKNGEQLAIDGRGTDIFRKIDGEWKIVHEHYSVPVDPITGQAVFLRTQ